MPSAPADAITALHEQLLGTPRLPVTTLWAIYGYARSHGNVEMLEALARRADTPGDLLEALAQGKQPDVTAALLARPVLPGRDRPERVSNAAVERTLRSAAVGPGARYYAAQQALTLLAARPTKTLTTALLKQEPSWFTSTQVHQMLLAADRVGVGLRPPTLLVARLGEALACDLLGRVSHFALLRELVRFAPPVAVVVDMLTRMARTMAQAPPVQAPRDEDLTGWDEGRWRQLAAETMWRRSDQETQEIIGQLQAAGVAQARTLTPTFGTREQPLTWSGRPQTPPPEVLSLAVDNLPALRLAAADTSVSLVRHVVHLVVQARDSVPDVDTLVALLANPVLAGEDLDKLLSFLEANRSTWWACGKVAEALDVVLRRADDPQVVARWARLAPQEVLIQHGWAPFGGPAKAVELVTQWSYSSVLLRAAARAGLRDDQLLELPVKVLTTLLQDVREQGGGDLPGRVARLLNDTLGSDATAWAMVADLAADGTGTLSELLVTVQALRS